MKKVFVWLLFAAVAVPSAVGAKKELKLAENNVEKILKELTLEEKVHLVVGAKLKGNDEARAEVGYTQKIVPGCAGTTYPIPRLGIPPVVMADGPAGLRISPRREGDEKTYFCTGFPVGILLASTWDGALVEKVGRAMGNEVLEYGVDVLLAPGVNIMRNPLCGRNFEYYSEDPLLAGKTAAAMIRGVQSNGVGTSLKHFAGNSQEINRLGNDARISLRALREIYLRNFEIAVRESQPWTVMTSYNYINGVYTSEDPGLLQNILRDEWGFLGAVVSDWGGGLDAQAQVRAGNDMLQSGTFAQYQAILDGVRNGAVDEKSLDDCVRRILRLIVKTPRFRGYAYSSAPDLKAHAAVSREAASDGMVLLRNENRALPFDSKSRVALFGISSYDFVAGGGGSGDVNKDHVVNIREGLRSCGFSIDGDLDEMYLRHLEKEHARIDPLNGKRPWFLYQYRAQELENADRAVCRAAQDDDIAVITISRASAEGFDRHVERDFMLHFDELAMIKEVSREFHRWNKKVAVVLNICSPVEVASWRDCVDAILVCWNPGGEGGVATVDVLSGKVNPSGHLPVTFPVRYADVPSQTFPVNVPETGRNQSFEHFSREKKYYDFENIDYTNYTEDIMVGYRHFLSSGVNPAYAFGYGLSYTEFRLSDPEVKKEGDGWKICCRVTNVGDRPGREVVQLYSSHPSSQVAFPSAELRSYAKTPLLGKGESCELGMKITQRDLAYFSEKESAWIADAGTYTLGLGFSSDALTGKCKVEVNKTVKYPVKDVMRPKEGSIFVAVN